MKSSQERSSDIEALFQLHRLSDAQVSPGGECVAFIAARYGKESDAHPAAQIWTVSMEGEDEMPLTSRRGSHRLPRWSPASRGGGNAGVLPRDLAFASDRRDPARGVHLPYVLPSAGGEAELVSGIDGDVSDIRWLPDGQHLLLLVKDREPEGAGDPVFFEENDPYVRLWLADLRLGEAAPVTPSGMHVWEYDLAPDGRSVVALVSDAPQPRFWYGARLVMIDVCNCEECGATDILPLYHPPADLQLARPVWSPDARRVAVLACTCSDPGLVTGDVLLVDRRGSNGPVNLTTGNPVSVNWMEWTAPECLIASGYEEGKLALARIKADGTGGSYERLWRRGCASPGRATFTVNTKHQLVMPRESAREPAEIWVWDLAGEQPSCRPLTSINSRAREWCLGETEEVGWTAHDGLRIQGLLVKPVNFAPEERCPLVVHVHGGPTSLHTHRFYAAPDAWAQLLAQRGFAVLLPNPRGSAGWGREFSDANIGRIGEDDYTDIIAGIDHCVASGVADPDRIGIGGGSYGGYIAAWGISQSERFSAAVVSAGISNVVSFYGTSDRPNYAQQFHDADPYAEEVFARYSPITYARQMDTPTLIIHGDKDQCCHVGQAMELYRALQGRAPVRLAIYPREGHGMREKSHIRDYLCRVMDWFEKYLTEKSQC